MISKPENNLNKLLKYKICFRTVENQKLKDLYKTKWMSKYGKISLFSVTMNLIVITPRII